MKIASLIIHILVSILFIIGVILPLVTGAFGEGFLGPYATIRYDTFFQIYAIVLIGMVCLFASVLSLVFGLVAFVKRKRIVPFTVFEIINSVYGIVASVSYASILFTVIGKTVDLGLMLLFMVPLLFIILMNVTTFVLAIINRILERFRPEEPEDEFIYSSQDGTMYNPEFDEQYSYQFDRR